MAHRSGSPADAGAAVIAPAALDILVRNLAAQGYAVIGPTVRDGAVVYDAIAGIADLPAGWIDDQDAGRYRLRRTKSPALFGHALGPHGWKAFFYPPRLRLWQARREGQRVHVEAGTAAVPRLALLGVRSCELHAIAIHDRVFLGAGHVDEDYRRRREAALVIAVNCGRAGGTCFCVSMDTGPAVGAGFDLALTELVDGGHRFVAETGSERGAALLAALPRDAAGPDDLAAARAVIERTRGEMGRVLDTRDIKPLLQENSEHPRWDAVADRCLGCTNCTMVCPTCFCHTVEDVTDLTGEQTERWRSWDSCFTLEHSYLHGGSVRRSGKARYRQWLTHKLAHWIDQFGTSGCVGCGRCISWCPVGIDLTQEVAAIRATDARGSAPP